MIFLGSNLKHRWSTFLGPIFIILGTLFFIACSEKQQEPKAKASVSPAEKAYTQLNEQLADIKVGDYLSFDVKLEPEMGKTQGKTFFQLPFKVMEIKDDALKLMHPLNELFGAKTNRVSYVNQPVRALKVFANPENTSNFFWIKKAALKKTISKDPKGFKGASLPGISKVAAFTLKHIFRIDGPLLSARKGSNKLEDYIQFTIRNRGLPAYIDKMEMLESEVDLKLKLDFKKMKERDMSPKGKNYIDTGNTFYIASEEVTNQDFKGQFKLKLFARMEDGKIISYEVAGTKDKAVVKQLD